MMSHPMWMLILLLGVSMSLQQVASMPRSKPDNHTLNVALLIPFTEYWELGDKAASAIIPAMEEIERRQLLPGYQVNWVIRDTGCVSYKGNVIIIE